MQIRAGYDISIRCESETPLVALLNVHPSRTPDLRSSASIRTRDDVPLHTFTDGFGNTCLRALVPPGVLSLEADFVIDDPGSPAPPFAEAAEVAIHALPDAVLPYLAGSRYCETDKLSPVAWSLFAETPRGAMRVEAIVAYVRDRIEFGYEYASPTMSAWEVHRERRGVSRDFVHLAVSLCRCMNIPARYCSGYALLTREDGTDAPTDFSAWLEVYLGDRWYPVDPRHVASAPGRIAMAYGRDAADVPIYTTFGPSTLERFRVFTIPA